MTDEVLYGSEDNLNRWYERHEGERHGTTHAIHSDFPLSDVELLSYPPAYREGYKTAYWAERNR